MIRLWVILGILVGICFFCYKWLLGKNQKNHSADDAKIIKEDESLDNDQSDGGYRWPLGLVLGLLGIAVVVFLILPRLGLHPLALIQKFIPILGTLRNLIL